MIKILKSFRRVKCEPRPVTWADVPEGQPWLCLSDPGDHMLVRMRIGNTIHAVNENGSPSPSNWPLSEVKRCRPLRPLDGPAPTAQPAVYEKWGDVPEGVEVLSGEDERLAYLAGSLWWMPPDGCLMDVPNPDRSYLEAHAPYTATGYRIEATWSEE